MELTLFLENGKTFKFENVTKVKESIDFIEFSYISMSTGKKKIATINTTKILGLAYSMEEDTK